MFQTSALYGSALNKWVSQVVMRCDFSEVR